MNVLLKFSKISKEFFALIVLFNFCVIIDFFVVEIKVNKKNEHTWLLQAVYGQVW